ncbi:hypothetical protein CFK37_04750 [Virgibacillus phasianinus]|uniref:Uncharacterized protein n=1 Tax=Virgibacillus phasianinus TaxID=2017483 RepID=A0A220U125_9BACI|nr:DUF3891 family protein [Virgibacillus phasianinus]ASK61531.1 hypothetical protein CFK37_04750 [Virgibacillus phasianinus]
MIIRERQDDIVMITQDNHARIAGVFAANWKNSFFNSSKKRNSVELAINEHDRGWIPVDCTPFMNDQNSLPYTFMYFPTKPKLIFYKNGIDEVEQMDNYAGILCSHHYARFAANDSNEESQAFVQHEENRQRKLKEKVKEFDPESFQFHYDLLNFCDNLSLYVCLNEPGTAKVDEHQFYKSGIPIPTTFSFLGGDYSAIHWQNKQTVMLSDFPFEQPTWIEIKQKVVSKQKIIECGLVAAYKDAPIEIVPVSINKIPRS